MTQADILIIGAGASGLMAARELAKAGKKVIVLEARNRTGGRIHSIKEIEHKYPAETGAEFIHGELPVTMKLIEEAGITIHESGGQAWRSDRKGLRKQDFFIKDWELLIQKLMEQKKDMSIAQFMEENFEGEKYEELRKSVKGFVEGYDAADTERASIFALREEWSEEEELTQYHPDGGYGKLIRYLEKNCTEAGVQIYLSTPVQTISWEKGRVEVVGGQDLFIARKTIVTVPLGVLRAEPSQGGISFIPPLTEKIRAAHSIGFGAVIKFLALFKEPFWEGYTNVKGEQVSMKEMGFMFSEAEVPTWWTQFPVRSSLLTGWLAGPRAEIRKNSSDAELRKAAIQSLTEIFQLDKEAINHQLISIEVINWTAEQYTQGAYAYATLETPAARAELSRPVEHTVYFAGEALYEGAAMGTVEAALASGLYTAQQITANSFMI